MSGCSPLEQPSDFPPIYEWFGLDEVRNKATLARFNPTHYPFEPSALTLFMPELCHPFLNDGIEARAYQIAAAKECIRTSTLLVMPTGFGKTAVQWYCMAEALSKDIDKIVLTAPTVGLVSTI